MKAGKPMAAVSVPPTDDPLAAPGQSVPPAAPGQPVPPAAPAPEQLDPLATPGQSNPFSNAALAARANASKQPDLLPAAPGESSPFFNAALAPRADSPPEARSILLLVKTVAVVGLGITGVSMAGYLYITQVLLDFNQKLFNFNSQIAYLAAYLFVDIKTKILGHLFSFLPFLRLATIACRKNYNTVIVPCLIIAGVVQVFYAPFFALFALGLDQGTVVTFKPSDTTITVALCIVLSCLHFALIALIVVAVVKIFFLRREIKKNLIAVLMKSVPQTVSPMV